MKMNIDASAVLAGAGVLLALYLYNRAKTAVDDARPKYQDGSNVPWLPTIFNLPAVTSQAAGAVSDAWDQLTAGTH